MYDSLHEKLSCKKSKEYILESIYKFYNSKYKKIIKLYINNS
jgi:hypothetical protein